MKRQILSLIVILLIIGETFVFSLYRGNKTQPTVSNTAIKYYENVVAITFDDGPRRSTTTKLLDGLEEMDVKATFFLVGKYIEGNEDIVKRMYDDGDLIGNHTYNHIDLSTVSNDEAMNEIANTNNLIYNITGYTPLYIRPPFGKYTERLQSKINMTPVMWSVDPNDWCTEDVGAVIQSVVTNVKSGDIILLHDFYDTSVTAALEIIAELKERGFIFVTVDQIILD